LRAEFPPLPNSTRIHWTGETSVWVDNDGNVHLVDGRVLKRGEIDAPGIHNARNAALALNCVATLFPDRVKEATVSQLLRGFSSLPHRLEELASGDGRIWIDDGLATTPEAAMAGLATLGGRQVTLIVGGADRGLSYEMLGRYLKSRSAPVLVITVPQSGYRIADELASYLDNGVIRANSFSEALEIADRRSPVGSTVLLSPAAPSFGEFNDYEDRSRVFAEYVATLGSGQLP
jgi:UDP-N-acetylmuramoylalanine--D-glutamate ligase